MKTMDFVVQKMGKLFGSKQVTSMDVVPGMLGFEDKTN